MEEILAYRRGVQIKFSLSSLSPTVIDELEAALCFKKRKMLRGKEATIARKLNLPTIEEEMVCACNISTDEHGRDWFSCCYGFESRISKILKSHEFRFRVEKLHPEEFSQLEIDYKNLRSRFPTFRYLQKEALDLFCKYDCGTIVCPTAWGKSTVMKMACLLFPTAKIDIICPLGATITQIHESLKEITPDVGLVGVGSNYKGARINCYCSDKSVAKSDFQADLVFVDELPECANPDMLEQLVRYRRARHWGLTASLERWDNGHRELESLFGPVRLKVPYDEAAKNESVAKIQVHVHSCPSGPDKSSMYPGPLRDKICIWLNSARNDLLAEIAQIYYRHHGQTLIYVDRMMHLIELKKRLPDWAVVYSPDQVTKTKDNLVEDALERKIFSSRDVITRYSMNEMRKAFASGKIRRAICTSVWKVGIDLPLMKVVVRGDGLSGFIAGTQIAGRSARFVKGQKEESIVVDLNDEFCDPYANKFIYRWQDVYKKHKWKVVQAKCQNGKIVVTTFDPPQRKSAKKQVVDRDLPLFQQKSLLESEREAIAARRTRRG